ncbi:hypothetical protein [Hoylesella enoeca]|uniref:hypothetical protein n=1 Tax=Hoylesella enoeca TaxID=76123 RepID=UPI0028899686|nr:hypothetical protein [Hoylesella enoeca]
MRKQVFNKACLLSWAALWGIAIAFASCSNEGVSQDKTTDNDNNNKNLTTFVTGGKEDTRTTMDYPAGNFYWEAGDKIYVKDDDGTWQASSNAPTAKTAYFKFLVPGKFNKGNTYKVYYPGKNGNNNQVTIPATQTQTTPNSTAHFGVSGDCGTADASWVTAKHGFEFTLDHQAAILVFQPYMGNDNKLVSTYLTKIEVTSDNDITDTYTLDETSGEITGIGTGKQIILTTKDPKYGSTNYNGFPLTNSSPSVMTNGAYMLIKPGTHTLKIRYWIKDVDTDIEGIITKSLTAHAFDKNKYYNMTTNLDITDYDGDHYYMWDAEKQYWDGYEWTKHLLPAGTGQPTHNGDSSPNYPQSNSDPRYYNEYFPGTGMSNSATHTPCKDLPNANEMSWYCMKGDPRWDGDRLWTIMGHLHKGGMWFLKKANITGYRTDKAYDNATDYRTAGGICTNNTLNPGLPSAADANKYFYLPALGQYNSGLLTGLEQGGYYWSSNSFPWGSDYAFGIYFFSNNVEVYSTFNRDSGFWAQKFE